MPSLKLIISPTAITDLKKLVKFNEPNWCKLKAHQYIEDLKSELHQLMTRPKIGISRDELFPGIRNLSVDSHVIFYRVQKKQIEIISVLHGRRDPKMYF